MIYNMATNTNIYNVDWGKLARWLTPTVLRKNIFTAFLNALITPISLLHNSFMSYRSDVNYRLSITVQAVYLQKLLNDRFDIDQRRILVEKQQQYNALYLYLRDENKPLDLYTKAEALPLTLRTKSEINVYTVDFIVKVPFGLHFSKDEMQGVINAPGNKLESKTYKIVKYHV